MGPLAGIRIVELGGIGPGPFTSMLFSEMGADILRISRPASTPPGIKGFDKRHQLLNRGRRAVAMDLKNPRAVEAVRRMIAKADAVTEGFRPGVAERLGLGPDDCLRLNPKLVYGRITGWGQDGPLASAPGHDINYIALTGALHAIGPKAARRYRRSTWSAISVAARCTSPSVWSARCSRRARPAAARWSTPR